MKRKPYLALGVVILVFSAALSWGNPLQVVQWKIADLFFRPHAISDLITIVAIDDKSLSSAAELGRFKDWPRSYYAQLVRALAPAKPALVAFDLDFREASRGMSDLRVEQLLHEYEKRNEEGGGSNFPWHQAIKQFKPGTRASDLVHPDDIDFQKAINEASFPVVLTSALISLDDPSKGVIAPIFSGENIPVGYWNNRADRDGVVRRFLPQSGPFVSFSAAMAKTLRPETALPNSGPTLIRYAGRPGAYRSISFVDILRKNFQPADIEGKVLLVGTTAAILQDTHPTPTSRNPMPGVEINAAMTQQLLDGRTLREQSSFSLFFLLTLFTIGGSVLFFRFSLRGLVVAFVLVFLGWPLAAYALFQTGRVVSVVYPEIAWILTALTCLWYRNKTEFREKNELKRAFSHYVSPVVVNELINTPEALELGGKRKVISVLFSDIVGFTTLAEKLTPEDTVALLNDYLTAMTEVIFEYHGTLDKYQGDAIMALFGVPLEDTHHAVNAGRAALAMRKALVALHEKWNRIDRLPFKDELVRLDFRVGIATGDAVVGNIGSEKRFDYTAIGDIVNLGSRLESINRKYGTHVIVDKETFTVITNNHNPFVFRKLDTVRVKGKTKETEIFEVFALAENVTSDMKTMLDEFENGRILYTQRNFAEAKQYFDSALAKFPADAPSQIYRNRCQFYLRKPPSRDWDAVVNLEEK